MRTNFKNILKFLICLCMCVLAGVFFAACSAIQSDYRYKGGGSSDSGSSSGGSGGSSGGGGSSDQGGSGDVTPDVPTGDEITIRYDYGAGSLLFGTLDEITLYETIKTNVGIVKLPTIKSEYSAGFLGWFNVSNDQQVKVGDKPRTDIDVYAKFDMEKLGVAGLFENGRFVKTWAKIKEENPNAFFGTAIMSNAGDSYLTSLKGELVIGSDITEIQSYAFEECDYLTKIIIPDSVTTIGEYAFSDCSNLQNLTIGKGVTSISTRAFADCTKLENVYFNATNCGDLADAAYILANVGADNDSGFTITVGKNVTRIPNNFCRYKPSELVTGNLKNVVYEENSQLTSIGEAAFGNCDGITSMTIPAGVESIGYAAFANCSNLTNLVLPEGLTSLGNYVFQACGFTSINIPASLTSISYAAFNGCDKLTTVTFAPNSKLTTIETAGFVKCSSLSNINLPEGLITIGEYAFQRCGFTSITIPSSVTEILLAGISYIDKLTTVTFAANSHLTTIGKSAFNQCTNLTNITIPAGVTTIGMAAFNQCTNLTSITIPATVTSLGDGAFNRCDKLTTITFAANSQLISIGYMAFNQCFKLSSINLPNSVEQIGKYAFQNCEAMTLLTLPSSLKFIADGAFNHCNKLQNTTITIPASVVQIGGTEFVGDNETNNILGTHVFYDCATATLTNFVVEAGNTHFVAIDGVLYTKNKKYLVAYPSANTRNYYKIEDGCERMFEMAISRPFHLNTLEIPNSYKFLSASSNPSTFLNQYNSLDAGLYVFSPITAFVVSADNPNVKAVDGILYSKDGTKLVAIPTRKWDSNKVLSFASEMTTIDYMLKGTATTLTYDGITVGGCPSIILLSANVTNISQNAFYEVGTESAVKIFTELSSRPAGWASSLGINENRIYYYSETAKSGNYWHYVNGVPTAW